VGSNAPIDARIPIPPPNTPWWRRARAILRLALDPAGGAVVESDNEQPMSSRMASARALLTTLVSDGLVQQARRASVVFAGLTLLVTAAEILVTTEVGRDRQVVATSLLFLWFLWSLRSHHRPSGSRMVDVVAAMILLGIGLAAGSAGLILAPALVTLYQRTLLATVRQAVSTGLLLFGAFAITRAAEAGGSWWLTLEVPAFLIAFAVITLVLQALGAAALSHEHGARWERVLTDVSAELLAVRTLQQSHRVAVEGARRLVDRDDATVALWLERDRDTLELVAAAGPERHGMARIDLSAMPAAAVAAYRAGRPHLLDRRLVGDAEAALGHPRRFAQAFVAPVRVQGGVGGALVVAGPTALDPELTDYLGRFANEVSLAEDRARLVDELERTNAELERSHEIKNQFLSMVSHELRTPLTSICGFTATLLEHWSSIPDETRQEYLRIVARQGQHQHRLVDDLLTTSRIMSGRLRVAPGVVDVRATVTAALEEVGLPPDEVDVLLGDRVRAWADAMHVHQILTNLLSNARKYGAPPYDVLASVEGGVVRLEVRDHGPGVPAAFQAHLFDPFRQGHAGDTRAEGGVGLGLAIVRELALANHGSVTYDGTGPGASFVVRLPAAATAGEARHAATTRQATP
jgi:signal transduction histidine kinase